MKPTYNLCDICKEKTQLSIVLTTDRRMDPAGSMDDITHLKDLCEKCLEHLTGFILSKLLKDPKFSSYESHQEILKWIGKK
jgi:hypothetical protein